MKAVIYRRFGPPTVLQLQEVEAPRPQDDEVLVRVRAVSINFGDASFVSGKPFLVRLMGAGLRRPKYPILGSDVAGRVEAVGRNVTMFQPGDEVFGETADNGWGGLAEFNCVPERVLALKPSNLTFEQAAAVPQAATVALQGLRDKGQVQAGQEVLIHGASGGVGTFAVQIARSFGARVTGVCSTKNVDLVLSLGAERVIDYTREDFALNGQRYDLILAIGGSRSIFDYSRALKPQGTYVMVGGAMSQIFQAMLLGPALSRKNGKKLGNLAAKPNQSDLAFIAKLLEAGEIVPVVDRCYPLSETADAISYYGKGHTRGKVVITLNSDAKRE